MTEPGDAEQQTLLRELLEAERACPDPPAEVGERVFSQLASSLGLPPDLPQAPAPEPAASITEPAAGLLQRTAAGLSKRGLVTFLVGAAVGAATYGTLEHVRHEPAPAPATMVVTAPVPESPRPPVPEPTAKLEPAPVAMPAARPSEAQAPPRDARDRGLGAERKLVEMARSALARGETERALSTLQAHARRFPNGQLAEERDSLMVGALVAKGEFAQARERAVRFRRQHPGSLFGPVVEHALRSIP